MFRNCFNNKTVHNCLALRDSYLLDLFNCTACFVHEFLLKKKNVFYSIQNNILDELPINLVLSFIHRHHFSLVNYYQEKKHFRNLFNILQSHVKEKSTNNPNYFHKQFAIRLFGLSNIWFGCCHLPLKPPLSIL